MERAAQKAKAREERKSRIAELGDAVIAAKKRTRREARAILKREAETRARRKADETPPAIPEVREEPPAQVKNTPAAKEPVSATRPTPEISGDQKKSPFPNLFARKIWFHTCEGEHVGPMTFEALQAAASSLDPRLDMVWKKGMENWQPAGQINGLFERASAPTPSQPARSLAARRSKPHRATKASYAGKMSWSGARRRDFIFALLVFPFIWHFGLLWLHPYLVKEFGPITMARFLPFAALAPVAVGVHFALKRLVNLGMSRWWSLAIFAPVLNLWLLYRGFACPPGYARHKRLDGAGIALAIPYWFIVLTIVFSVTTDHTPNLQAINTSALVKQFRIDAKPAGQSGIRPR
jgi:hypothetical protein